MLLLTNLANQGLYATWVFSTTMRFDWSTAIVGVVFAVMGVCFALSQGLLVGPVVKRLGERRSILVGLMASVVVYLAYALVPEGWMVFLVIVVGALGAIDEPATQALLSASVDETEQGAIQGAVASLLSITAIVGPLVSTGVFSLLHLRDRSGRLPGGAVGLRRAAGAGRAGRGLAVREAGAPAGRGRPAGAGPGGLSSSPSRSRPLSRRGGAANAMA